MVQAVTPNELCGCGVPHLCVLPLLDWEKHLSVSVLFQFQSKRDGGF